MAAKSSKVMITMEEVGGIANKVVITTIETFAMIKVIAVEEIED